MNTLFEKDLEATFGVRAQQFSPELRQFLEELWNRGFLAGGSATSTPIKLRDYKSPAITEPPPGTWWRTHAYYHDWALRVDTSSIKYRALRTLEEWTQDDETVKVFVVLRSGPDESPDSWKIVSAVEHPSVTAALASEKSWIRNQYGARWPK